MEYTKTTECAKKHHVQHADCRQQTTTGEFQDTTISNQSINKKHIQYNNDTMCHHINLCCATTYRRRNSFNISALMMVLLLLLAYCFFCRRPNRSPCRICYFWYIFLHSDHVDLSERGGLRIFFSLRVVLHDCMTATYI